MGKLAAITGIIVLLAGVDVAEAIIAKEWSARRSHWLLAAGIVSAVVLFVLFSVAVRYTEMSTVTLGWIVVMQVGLMLTEHFCYQVDHGVDRWAAVAAMVALQGYLLITSGPAS